MPCFTDHTPREHRPPEFGFRILNAEGPTHIALPITLPWDDDSVSCQSSPSPLGANQPLFDFAPSTESSFGTLSRYLPEPCCNTSINLAIQTNPSHTQVSLGPLASKLCHWQTYLSTTCIERRANFESLSVQRHARTEDPVQALGTCMIIDPARRLSMHPGRPRWLSPRCSPRCRFIGSAGTMRRTGICEA